MSKFVEEWRPIKDYEGLYEASDWGRVRSLDRIITHKNGKKIRYIGKILVPRMRKDGYLMVQLSVNGNVNGFLVHKLLAETFLPIPEELQHLIGTRKLVVGHTKPTEDGKEDKTANEAWNIRWMSQEENNNFGTKGERLSKANKNGKKSKQVYQYDLEGKLINIWESVNECHRNGFDSSNVCNCCKGKYFDKRRGKWYNITQYKGYKWSYEPL